MFSWLWADTENILLAVWGIPPTAAARPREAADPERSLSNISKADPQSLSEEGKLGEKITTDQDEPKTLR